MDTVNVVVGKVVDLLFAVVGRQVNYLIQHKDNVNNFKQKVEDLKGARQRIQGRIDEANRKGEIIEAEVETWITSVDVLTPEAERFLASEEDAAKKNACFNLRSRYNSSKKATKMTSSVDQLLAKGDKFATVPVSHRAPPPGIDSYESKNIDAYKSQSSVMKEVMDALKDESNHVLGVCGIGGVGKTTLVMELGKRVKESKQFDEVVMAVVSQPINKERTVQDVIAHKLGMDPLPDNNQLRREELWKRINKEKKILVILDDLWSKLNLDELGIPVGSHGSSYCQVILTSRSKDVCREMEAQKIITVTPMPEDEAWSLFKTVAGGIVETDNEINQIAKKVAKKCGGLPIAILAVGRALKNKKSKVEWEDARRQLEKAAPPTVNPMLKDVFPKLKLSYEYLEDQDAKSCFLLCCMFPEDYEIPIELLAEYGMGLRLFRDSGESFQEARLGARSAVSTLKGSCLLLDGKDNGHVKMHDVVRDVAIVIASEDERNTFLVKTGMGWTEWLEGDSFDKYVGISLMQNDIAKIPVELELPKLQILLLRGNTSLSEIPNEFLQRMKVLKVMDLVECSISSLPKSISLLTTLRSLHLDGSKFKEISVLEGLKKLEILSVPFTDIIEIPEQIGHLTSLRFLDMRRCKLSHIAAGVISSLHKLEDLYVGDSFMRWDVNDVEEESNQIRKNTSLKELESLAKLRFLDIVVPDIKVLPQNLQLKSLQRFMITIGCKDWHDSIRIEHPDCSILDLTDMNIPVLSWIKKLTDAAEYLILNSIKNLRNVIKDLNKVDLNNKRFLEISNCDDVSSLADKADLESKPAFCNLEKLKVSNLKKFIEMCHGGQLFSTGGSFQKLRELSIYGCGNISAALGFNMLTALQNLTKLEVRECNSIEYILGSMRPEIYKPGEEGYTEEEEILPMLKDLVLYQLPNLVDIWNDHHGKFVSHLEIIQIHYCGKLRRVFSHMYSKDVVFCLKSIYIWRCNSLEYILEPELVGSGLDGALQSPCFQYLESVKLYCCENLRYVFSSSIAEGLSQLRQLDVGNCSKLEAIIIGGGFPESDEGNENVIEASSSSSSTLRTEPKPKEKKKIIVFPSLSSISLWSLISLKSFCSVPNYTCTEYPSLDHLDIRYCPKLESWGFGIQIAPNLKPDKIEVGECGGYALTKSDDGRELIAMAPQS